MTAETESPGSKDATEDEVAMRRGWGRTALRILILVVAFAALVAFSVLLAELTLTPSPASRNIAGSNLRPGHSLRQYADDYTFLAACKQVGGNLLIGAPFGIILPVLVPRRLRMVRVVVLTAVVMVLVELAQGALVEGRAFDVDDVILNTSGAIIAYVLIGRIIGRKYHALADPVPVRRRRFGWSGRAGRSGDTTTGPVAVSAPTPEDYRELKGAKGAKSAKAVRESEEAGTGRTAKTLKRVKEPGTIEKRGSTKAGRASGAAASAKGGPDGARGRAGRTAAAAKKKTAAPPKKPKTKGSGAAPGASAAPGRKKGDASSEDGTAAGTRRAGGLSGLLRRL
jgi:glycopeptide antibiotics resistance protein